MFQIYFYSNASILYFFVCVIMIFSSDLIKKYYNEITSYFCWIVLDIIYLFMSLYLSGGIWYYAILTLYLINTFIIMKIGNNYEYLLFGILISLLQSEYWELPIHIYWGEINIGTLIMFFYIMHTMYILKINYIEFIKYVASFTPLYFLIVFYLYPFEIFRNNYLISDFFFRIICSIFFIFFSYMNHKKTHKVDNYISLGDTLNESI